MGNLPKDVVGRKSSHDTIRHGPTDNMSYAGLMQAAQTYRLVTHVPLPSILSVSFAWKVALWALIILAGSAASAQSQYEVATIRPSAPGTTRHMQIRGTRFATEGTTVVDLLQFAYGVHTSQIVGGPNWIKTDRFDISADPEMERRPSSSELKTMTARLLADRFHLVLANEEAVIPVFALVRVKAKLQLKSTVPDSTGILSGGLVPPGSLFVHNGTVGDFIAYLQRYAPPEIDRPIVNQTDISGRYEFELHFCPEGARDQEPTEVASPTTAPDIFTAIRDQLGLRLQPTRTEVKVLRIITISVPTPN